MLGRLHHSVTTLGVPPDQALVQAVRAFLVCWTVDFSNDTSLDYPETQAKIRLPRFVIGLANGWAKDSDRVVYISPEDVCLPPPTLKISL